MTAFQYFRNEGTNACAYSYWHEGVVRSFRALFIQSAFYSVANKAMLS